MTVVTPSVEVDDYFVELGARVEGRVLLPGAEGLDPSVERIREVRVALHYWTEGRGDSDSWHGAPQVFDVNIDGSLHGRFSLDVPANAPISYDGSLFRVRWEVEARTDLKLRIDKTAGVGIVVLPAGGHGLYLQPHPLARVRRSG